MVSVRVYIEGGGKGDLARRFREGWQKFLQPLSLPRRPAVVMGGSREATFDKFTTAIRSPEDDMIYVLLVDSEVPVPQSQPSWEFLKLNDYWDAPPIPESARAFLMVQSMEAWLLADREGLLRFFGNGFNVNQLPRNPNLEEISVADALNGLLLASRNCSKQYQKGKISFQLLGFISPTEVEKRCVHAKDFFDFLRSRLG